MLRPLRLTANLARLAVSPTLQYGVSCYSSITQRRRKEMGKSVARRQRELLAFAALFDPLRTARAQVYQTLEYLGWESLAGETVGESLVVDFTFLNWFVAVEVVEGESYVLPDDPTASTDCGFGPGVPHPHPKPTVGKLAGCAPSALPAHRPITPMETAFTSAPPSWLNPVRGLVLNQETAARHAAIRARGWELIVVPQPLWAFAASRPKDAHYSRRDLLSSLVLPVSPFEPRPESALRGQERKTRAGAWAAGLAAAAKAGVRKQAALEAASARLR